MSTSFSFSLSDYNCIGFDLDHTLVTYKLEEVFKLVHQYVTCYCVKELGFHSDLLKSELDVSRCQRGVFYDKQNGNIVTLDGRREVAYAVHGRRIVTATEIRETYGDPATLPLVEDLEAMFMNGMGQLLRPDDPVIIFRDYFGAVFTQIASDVIELIDLHGPLESRVAAFPKYDIWPLLYPAIRDLYRMKAFHKIIYETPAKYINPVSAKVKEFLARLERKGKILFLITSSDTAAAHRLLDFAMGPGWQEYFHVVTTRARKPIFWTGKSPFLDQDASGSEVHKLESGGMYSQGNWSQLKQLLADLSGCNDPKVLYAGDSVLDDIYIPARYGGLDTITIGPEVDFSQMDTSKLRLFSHMVVTYSKLIIPSMEKLAELPL